MAKPDADGFVPDDDGFAPDAAPAKPPEKPSALAELASGPAAHGLVQGGSFGFGDELQGAMAAGLEGARMLGRKAGVLEPLDERDNVFAGANPAAGEGVLARLKSAYTSERDAARAEDDAAQAAGPKAYGAAALAAGLLAPGPKSLPGGTTTAKALSAGKSGAKLGALAGLGASDASDALDTAGDVLGGAAFGAAGGALSSAVASKLAPYLRKLAERRSFSALASRIPIGDSNLKELEALSPKTDPLFMQRALGRRALDEKLVMPFGTIEGAAKRTGTAIEDSSRLQGAMLQSIQDAAPTARVNPGAVAKALERQAGEASESSAQQGLAGLLRNRAATQRNAMLNRLQSKGTGLLTLPEAETEKRLLQDAVRRMSANYQKKGSDSLEATRRAASAMRQAVEDAAEKVAGPDDLASWLALKKRTGDLEKIKKIADYSAMREGRSDVGGLSEFADAIGRRMPGSESRSFATRAGDYALDALGRAWRERRPATTARALDAIGSSPLLERAPARSAIEQYMQLLEEKDTP